MEDETLELYFKTTNESLSRIEKDNKEQHEILFSKVNSLVTDVAQLKIKSGVWGFVAGAIPTSIVFIYLLIRSMLAKGN